MKKKREEETEQIERRRKKRKTKEERTKEEESDKSTPKKPLRIKFNLVGPFFFTKTERSKHTSSKRKNRIKTRIIDLTPPKFNKHL